MASLDSEQLPISHVYLPTTFAQAVGKYFRDNRDERECVVLGGWEVKRGQAGKRGGGLGMTEEVAVSTPKPTVSGVITRRQSGRMKPMTSGVESKGLWDEGGDLKRMVIAVNVVGIARGGRLKSDDDEGLKVVGVVKRDHQEIDEVTWRGLQEGGEVDAGACPVFLDFKWTEVPGGDGLYINKVEWRGRTTSIVRTNRFILFYYDPEEIQRWKVPSDYPLGLPKVVLDGLFYIQKWKQESHPHVLPAFPQVPLDHQDLQACSQIPATSFLVTNSLINFISTRSSGLQQIIHKVTLLMGAVLRTYPLLPVLNFLFLMLVDSIIGYLITRYLLQFPNMLGLLHTTVDQMLAKLNHLLKWLRGAPAGLKLNPNLNSLYWRFFSYHIHLWANYIGILEPVFAVILYTIQYFGVLGATIQVSLLKDLLSLATFHVYCLYIYATRLYSLQTTAIKALCRVFFGRKYNPLRKRIDSVQLTTPELFLSSFGFVILIFLFPTTMVYYTGFVFLRVPVLLIERLLQYLVIMYNKLPVISWLLVYLKSPRVADEIYLVPVDTSLTQISSGYQQTQNYLAFRICLQSTRKLFAPPNLSGGIKSIVSSVMDGTVLKE